MKIFAGCPNSCAGPIRQTHRAGRPTTPDKEAKPMKYESQKVAYWYILAALALFGIQVLGGLLAGWVYVSPNFLSELLPFNVIRMIHTNALIVWLLLGFFAAAYFLVPEESEREIWSPKLAYLQLIILIVGTLGAVGSYLVGIHGGREFLEQPLWVKFGILVAALIFLLNVSMTVLAGKMAAILAFLLLKLTGVDREVVEKWLYVIVATALFSGILGTGHHFYWIGLPGYWQWIGSIFSTFEVIPFFLMMSFAFVMVWKGRKNHPNRAALLWSLGSSTVAFFGAGVWGFLHTLHGVNFYSHGTQITAAHGHLAFYGAYVALNLAIFTYAMPMLRERAPYNQVLNMASFWLMTGGMAFMTFVLTFAGTIQTHMQRVVGDYYMTVQDSLSVFYLMRFGAGAAVVIGALLFLYSMLVVRKSEVIAPGPANPVPGE